MCSFRKRHELDRIAQVHLMHLMIRPLSMFRLHKSGMCYCLAKSRDQFSHSSCISPSCVQLTNSNHHTCTHRQTKREPPSHLCRIELIISEKGVALNTVSKFIFAYLYPNALSPFCLWFEKTGLWFAQERHRAGESALKIQQ